MWHRGHITRVPAHTDILGNVDIPAKQAVKKQNALYMSILNYQRHRDRIV